MNDITVDQYAGPYLEHPDFTWERREAAEQLLAKVNDLRRRAAAAGVQLALNMKTGCGISGERNGGFRPIDCNVGAKNSTHKRGRGIDLADPRRELAEWCYTAAGRAAVRELGLTLENVRWTPTWVHLQDVPPGPAGAAWRFDYIPSNAVPLAPPVPGQQGYVDVRLVFAIVVVAAFLVVAGFGYTMRLQRDAARESLSACNERVAVMGQQIADQNAAVARLSAAGKAAQVQGRAALEAARKAAQARENEMLRLGAIAAGTAAAPPPATGIEAGSCQHALQVIREDLK